jgi:hypothetical protein
MCVCCNPPKQGSAVSVDFAVGIQQRLNNGALFKAKVRGRAQRKMQQQQQQQRQQQQRQQQP